MVRDSNIDQQQQESRTRMRRRQEKWHLAFKVVIITPHFQIRRPPRLLLYLDAKNHRRFLQLIGH